MNGIECELKWALEPDGHARLERELVLRLGPARLLAQRNRFLDSADGRLRRSGCNLRLRLEDGGTTVTVKGRLGPPGQDGMHRHEEWERRLPADAFAAVPAAVAAWELPPRIAMALAGEPLLEVGSFANRRLEWREGGDLLCLDATDFGCRIDHELEIETDDPQAAGRWSGLLAAWRIGWEPQPLTKFARFLALRGRPRRVLAWGDSLTAGGSLPDGERDQTWPLLVQGWSAGRFQVANHGRGGRHSAERDGWGEALAGDPDMAVFLLGTNDSRETDGGAPERAAANLRSLAADLRAARPDCALAIAGPPNLASAFLGPTRPIAAQRQDNLRRMGELFGGLARELGSCYIPLYGRMPEERLSRDGVHPDGAGTALIARAILRRLEALG